ncbi:hypothetical protein KR94_01560 [Pantoea ananatis]|nr:hypothetical protein KR94_01560 [Pantoea ananatis]
MLLVDCAAVFNTNGINVIPMRAVMLLKNNLMTFFPAQPAGCFSPEMKRYLHFSGLNQLCCDKPAHRK